MKATEQYFPVVLFIMLNKVVLTFVCGRNPKLWPFKRKLLIRSNSCLDFEARCQTQFKLQIRIDSPVDCSTLRPFMSQSKVYHFLSV